MTYSVTNVRNRQRVFGRAGNIYLENEIISKYANIKDRLREIANASAEAAAESLYRDISSKHHYRGSLEESIDVKKARGGTQRTQFARATVGKNVKHSDWFFKGTGLYGPKKRIILPKKSKAMGPIDAFSYRSNDGPTYLASSRGQKPNMKIIYKAQIAADKEVQKRLRGLN